MKQFSHQNVVKLYGNFIARNETVVSTIMEICQCDLKKFIEKRNNLPLPLDTLLNWACQILCGVKYIHKNDVIHRDIKLEVPNFLIFFLA